jgi:hypothetical protein
MKSGPHSIWIIKQLPVNWRLQVNTLIELFRLINDFGKWTNNGHLGQLRGPARSAFLSPQVSREIAGHISQAMQSR